MNNFTIEIINGDSKEDAEKKVNQFIKECNDGGYEILGMEPRLIGAAGIHLYSFIFKIRSDR